MKNMMLTAHSGSDGTPENSMEFLREMIQGGITSVEVDVQISPTGCLYLNHDETKQWQNCVTLEEAFAILAFAKECSINCDLKKEGLEKQVFKLADEYGLSDRVILSGTVHLANLPEKRLVKQVFYNVENWIPTIYEMNLDVNQLHELLDYCKEQRIETVNIHHEYATETFIEYTKQSGINVSVWTVNEKEKIDRFKKAGIYNVTTRQALNYVHSFEKEEVEVK